MDIYKSGARLGSLEAGFATVDETAVKRGAIERAADALDDTGNLAERLEALLARLAGQPSADVDRSGSRAGPYGANTIVRLNAAVEAHHASLRRAHDALSEIEGIL